MRTHATFSKRSLRPTLYATEIPGGVLTPLSGAELTAWAAVTLQAQKHDISSHGQGLSQQFLSSLERITSADGRFSHLLGSCSLLRLPKGEMTKKVGVV